MLSMILASTFAVPMVVFSFVFIFSLFEQEEIVCQLGTLAQVPSYGQKGKVWLARVASRGVTRRIETATQVITEERVAGELVRRIVEFKNSMETQVQPASQPASQPSLAVAEMAAGEFESLVWACTYTDFSKAASDLLAKPKPQRGTGGRFVKRAKPKPSQEPSQVEREPLAPIPAVFSFFKALYQHSINILIHITQQFNNTYSLLTQ